MAETVQYENRCCPRCGGLVFEQVGEQVRCTACGAQMYPGSLKPQHHEFHSSGSQTVVKNETNKAVQFSPSVPTQKPESKPSSSNETEQKSRKKSSAPLYLALVQAGLFLISTLLFFLAGLYKTYVQEDYSHGWSGGKSITDLKFWRITDSSGPGKTCMIVALLLISAFLVASLVKGVLIRVKGEETEDSFNKAYGIVVATVLIGVAIFFIIANCLMPDDFRYGRTYSSSTQCYGKNGCYSYGSGTVAESNGSWWLVIIWWAQLMLTGIIALGWRLPKKLDE